MLRLVHVAGAFVFAMHLVSAILSYTKAAILWSNPTSARAIAFFQTLSEDHPWLLSFRAVITGTEAVFLVHFVSLAAISLVFALLYASLYRHAGKDDVSGVLAKWAVAFACVAAVSYPVFTQDLWLSAVWGRMSAGGVNPYYVSFSPAWVGQLPLDHFPLTMSYGPLWAAIATATEAIVQEWVAMSFIIFKSLVAVAWLGSLYLLPRMMPEASALERSLAVLIFGWLPLSVLESVAEGHNDIVMTAFALLWLFLLLKRSTGAPMALAASCLCKYTTAPLLVIDFIVGLRRDGLTMRTYIFRLLPAGLLAVAVFALFFRSLKFFEALHVINSWPFLLPRDAITAIDRIAGGYLKPLAWASVAIFPLVAVFSLYQLYRDTSPIMIAKASLAVLCAVSFAAINHLWPWYLIWIIPFAAVAPHWWLSRFAVGLALLAPFTAIIWWIEALGAYKDVAALCLYSGALGWTWLSGRLARLPTASPEHDYGKTLRVS